MVNSYKFSQSLDFFIHELRSVIDVDYGKSAAVSSIALFWPAAGFFCGFARTVIPVFL
jgi:hypothetical protein